MMKKYNFLIMLVITAMGLFAQNNEHSFSLGVSLGLLGGQSEEIVYRNSKSGYMLSQLLWDMKPLTYAGVEVHYNWQNPANKWGLFTDAFFKFGIPGNTGIMEDRDWMFGTYPDWLTHYSVHDNRTQKAMLIDINAGASFKIFEKFLIKPFLSYSYMNFSWAASGGSFLYPDEDGDHFYLITDTDVITYEQTWNIISIGVSFYGAFNRYFDVDISIKLSPLIWCTAVDNHISRNIIFVDSMFSGFFFEPGLLFSFTPNDFFKLSLSVKYRNISGARGNAKIEGEQAVYYNIGGAGYSVFDIGLVATFTALKF